MEGYAGCESSDTKITLRINLKKSSSKPLSSEIQTLKIFQPSKWQPKLP
jgi:hypothetical protein